MNIMDGFETSSTAIVSLLRCSADIPLPPDLVCLSICTGKRNQAEYCTDSPTVICGECMSLCSQYPDILAYVSCTFGYPPILMSPSILPPVFLPERTSISVVFPAPLTPIKAVRIPGLNAPVMS